MWKVDACYSDIHIYYRLRNEAESHLFQRCVLAFFEANRAQKKRKKNFRHLETSRENTERGERQTPPCLCVTLFFLPLPLPFFLSIIILTRSNLKSR